MGIPSRCLAEGGPCRKSHPPELHAAFFWREDCHECSDPGNGSDIIKIAMNRVHRRLIDKGLKSRLLLQVHDELLMEAAPDEVDEVKKILDEEMKGAADLVSRT